MSGIYISNDTNFIVSKTDFTKCQELYKTIGKDT